MPTIVFLFVYLSQLLRIGEEEAAEEVAEEFLAADRETEPLVIPRGGRVSDDAWRVSTPATIGDDCRLHGNIRATEIDVGHGTEVFGSLRAKGDVRVGRGTVVHGDVTTKGGDVVVAPEAHVRGDISCEDCRLSEAAEVDGTIRAHGELTFTEGVPAGTEGVPAGTEEASADAQGAPTGAGRTSDGDAPDELTPAVVPLGEGELPEPEPASAFVRLGEGDLDVETTPAVRPVEDGEFDWEAIDEARPSTNGSADEVETIVADAEKQ